jgi:hypothetical protein
VAITFATEPCLTSRLHRRRRLGGQIAGKAKERQEAEGIWEQVCPELSQRELWRREAFPQHAGSTHSCHVVPRGHSLFKGHLSPHPADRQMFLATWKDIANENEAQFQIRDCPLNTGEPSLPQYPTHSLLCTH